MSLAASLTFAVERFAAVEGEIAPLWQAHFDEAGEDKAALPLDMDTPRYADLDRAGLLLIVTARSAGRLVGYVFALIGSHLHCRGLRQAVLDLHYLAPGHRGGRNAMRLFQATEAAARKLGVVRIMVGTPAARSQGRLLSALGWRPIETTFSKLIGEAA